MENATQPVLYSHPFSAYSQKVLIALYENGTAFTYRKLIPEDPSAMRELAVIWPLKKFPVLTDAGNSYLESSVIIEHLMLRRPGAAQLLPADAHQALEVRMLDRFFDNYVATPMQAIVADFIRPAPDRDPLNVKQAVTTLSAAYAWLDSLIAHRTWAAGDQFSLADCAAAPSLLYADWVHPIGAQFAHARAYRSRLLARPSVARAVEEARPYRHLFPPGAPNRD